MIDRGAGIGGREIERATPVWVIMALIALVVLSTLGEGGARPGAVVVVHGVSVLLVCAVLLSGSGSGRRLRSSASGSFSAFVAFFALAFLGAVVSSYAYPAWGVLINLATFAAIVSIAGRCGHALIRPLSIVLPFAAAAQGGLAIYQRIFEDQLRPAGTFLNPNHLAAWLLAAILVSLDHRGAGSRAGVIARVLLAFPAVVGLILTGSRGVLLGLLAASVWMLYARRGDGRRGWAVAATLGIVLLAVGAGVILRSSSYDPFRCTRVRIWKAALAVVADRPWTGTGPGQFSAAAPNLNFPLEDETLRFERHFVSPHSDLIRLPAEFGWPAAVAALAAILLAARELKRRRRNGEIPPEFDGVVAAMVALGVQAAVDDLSDRPALWLLVASLLGALLARPVPVKTFLRPATRAGVGFVLLVGFVLVDLADYRAWRLVVAASDSAADETALLDRAIRLNPLRAESWRAKADRLVRRERVWDPATYAAAREAAETAARLQPSAAGSHVTSGRVEARACLDLFRDESSRSRFERHFRNAEDLARHDPFIPMEAAELLLAASDTAGARRAAERALAIEPRAVAPRLLLAESFLGSGVVDGVPRAERTLREAEDLGRTHRDHPRESRYAERLLNLDEDRASRIRAGIRAALEVGSGTEAEGLTTGEQP